MRGARGSRLIARSTTGKRRWSFSGSEAPNGSCETCRVQKQVVIYGKPNLYKGKWNIAHPEVELFPI